MVQAYIVDASILIQAFVEDTYSSRVQTLIKQLFDDEPVELFIPEFCLAECTNILWKRGRFHGVSPEQLQQALANLKTLPLVVHSIAGVLPRALSIGLDHHLAIYDTIYIALSESLGHPLITSDERQQNVAKNIGITLKAITDFPEWSDLEIDE